MIKKQKLTRLNLFLFFLIYFASISPVADFCIGQVENNYIYDGKIKVDVIILLGGGVIEGVRDISGYHIPTPDLMMRIVDTARLYRKYKFPVIISGGHHGEGPSEASVAERFLNDLGINSDKIILEESSRDTVENAINVKKIFKKKGFKRGLLLTSGYHIRRSILIFKMEGLDVIPHSAGLYSEKEKSLDILDFLPNNYDLYKSAIALKECIGLIFYHLKYSFE